MTTTATPTLADARRVLHERFGYPSFRGAQEAIIGHVLAGGDALVLMPTGGGKSLCYQIPAIVREGVGVVVSPLIALMEDQVGALRQAGVRAAYLNSTLPPAEAAAVERDVEEGRIDLLYVAPERLLTATCMALLQASRLSLFAIDEAHCVSRWGHDFRPEYIGLGVLAERFAEVPRLALTATADAITRAEIVDKLHLSGAEQFVASFDRPNIRYTVVDKQDARRQLLAFYQQGHEGDAGIVYCLSRRSVDSTAAWLVKQGVNALPYHAGLSAETRRSNQQRFLREDGVVVVATIAFGMGIDKPDVRFVAHLDAPKSLEGYYQETGRAGRDGLPSDAFMTYGLGDVVTMRRMLADSDANEAFKRVERQKLDALLGYCETAGCRRRVLLSYFGEESGEACGNCDNCLTPVVTYDGTEEAQKVLSAAVRTGQRFGAGHLIDVLRGKATERVRGLGHDRLPTFGVGAERSDTAWRSVVRQLVAAGLLSTDAAGHGSLVLTPRSAGVLRGETRVALRDDPTPIVRATDRRPGRGRVSADLSGVELERFEALRAWRKATADAQGVPPYIIFHDATLRQIAEQAPATRAELARVSGVGASKLGGYGAGVLEVLGAQDQAAAPGSSPPSAPALPTPMFPTPGSSTPGFTAPSPRSGPAPSTPGGGPEGTEEEPADSVEHTRDLLLEGYGAEAVANMRGLKVRTIEGHLAELVRRGDLTVEEATGLTQRQVDEIEAATETLPPEQRGRLRPLFEALGERYSYAMLKCVLAACQR